MFVVTGTSGAGKTAVAPLVTARLTEAVVFETDVFGKFTPEPWERIGNQWLLIAHTLAQNGRSLVLLGTIGPERLEGLEARFVLGKIYYLSLTCDDEELERRLAARPTWRETSHKIEEHQRVGQYLNHHADVVIDTTARSPETVADEISDWIRARL